MATEQNRETARRFFEGFNSGELEDVAEFIGPGFIGRGPGTPPHTPGPEGYRQLVHAYRTGFPDLRMSIEEIVAEGDRVAVRWRARGTQQGDLLGIPPTGRRVFSSGMHFFRIVGGRIEEAWVDWDMLGTLQQLGVIPTAGRVQRRAA